MYDRIYTEAEEIGNRVIIPKRILQTFNRGTTHFKIKSSESDEFVYVSLLNDMTDEEHTIYIPTWIQRLLKLKDNDYIFIEEKTDLIPATFVYFESELFFNNHQYDHTKELENNLRSFTSLIEGQSIQIKTSEGVFFDILIKKLEPNVEGSIINIDLPFDYKRIEKGATLLRPKSQQQWKKRNDLKVFNGKGYSTGSKN